MAINGQNESQDIPPLVARILNDEALYGDGAPAWLKAPTSKDVRKVRKSWIKRLRRFQDDYPEAEQLAKTLTRCRRNRRCMSGACPNCNRAVQRCFVSNVGKLVTATQGQLVSISIVFPERRTPAGSLHTLHTAPIKRALAYTIGKTNNISWVAGGFDLSLNDDTQKGLGIAWQPQFYGFVATSDVNALSKLLRDRYPGSEYVVRPVKITACDGSNEALSYAFKTTFVKRIAYKDLQGRWNTRKVGLPAAAHVEAMLWMHQVGFSGRLFFKNVRMTRVGHHVELRTVKKLE